ncbi:MAG: hypothetical protein HRT69_01800 [Flavobacteriaceae bacterium]|nr:hypothetical protein [Flavobacteriaceae bacterium]
MALEINIGEEYKIKIEKESEFKDSIFKEVYTQAAKNVEEIILQAITNDNRNSISNDDYNNVIAFTGERGTGKSSSMISFADALKNKCDSDTFWKDNENLKKAKIKSLDIIDPSLFRNEDKLFEIIISKMFSKFQLKLKENDNKIKNDNKRDLIKKFQEVFNNLKILHNGKSQVYDKEAIEALSDLAYGINLKENFKKLVDEYLLCMYSIDNKKDKNGFLLIPIDDFDLNISGAYEMLEDIRQFLIQSNVIILIACKIEQLEDSIEQNFRTEYEVMMPSDGINYLSDKPADMASKFLLKLIPLNRRTVIPELNIREKILLEEDSENEKSFVIKKEDKILYENDNLQSLVLDFIYQETEIFITTSNNHNISIIPKTLRELNNLISLIYNSNNKKITFKDYIITTAKRSLPEDLFKIFSVLEETNILDFNVQFCNLIGEINSSEIEFNIPKDKYDLLNPRNNNNTSLGDVYSLLKIIEENGKVTNISVIKFLNLIKVYLAIVIKQLKLNENIEISQGGFSNEYFKIFPLYGGKTSRDWLSFDLKEIEKLSLIDKFILSFYIPYLGVEPKKYRVEPENIFFKPYNGAGGQFTKATFSPVFPLTRVIYLKKIMESFKKDEREEIEKTNVFKELKKFINNDFSLILNPFYYSEFINLLENKTKNHRDKLGEYGETVDLYMNTLGIDVLNKINSEYNLNTVNYIEDNPVYKYRGSSIFVKIFNEIFESFLKSQSSITKEIKELLRVYLNRIIKNNVKIKTVTRLINELIMAKAPDLIVNEIKDFRERLKNEDEDKIIKEIIEFLDKIIKSNG